MSWSDDSGAADVGNFLTIVGMSSEPAALALADNSIHALRHAVNCCIYETDSICTNSSYTAH